MSTYKGIPFNGGMDSPTGTGSQHLVETLKAIIDFLKQCTESGVLKDDGDRPCVRWSVQLLVKPTGEHVLDWNDCFLIAPTGGATAIDWNARFLYSSDSAISINWENRQLFDPQTGQVQLSWFNGLHAPNLPTSDPGVNGQLWNNAGVVTVSP